MLLRFSAANYRSLRTVQELSLSASALKDVETGLLNATAAGVNNPIVPAAVIYGANASGKSNVVRALRFLRSAVLLSHSRGNPAGGVPRMPFLLDTVAAKGNSEFNVDFIVDGVRYHYGFECSTASFEGEWLYSFPSGRRQLLFERRKQEFSFGRNLRGHNKVISDLTRPNSLFVSAAAQNDHEDLRRPLSFFEGLEFDGAISVSGRLLASRLAKGELDERILKFLEKVGTGVIGFRRSKRGVPEEVAKTMQDVDELLRARSQKGLEFSVEKELDRIEFSHRGVDGESVFLDAESESAGTRRLLMLLCLAFIALDNGTLLIVDELDASLHTQACEAILSLFSSPATNPKGAQLVATTHDTNLLCSPILRRDQVWFTEKDAEGATHLYPLSDFHTRRSDNVEKGYLQGRYGAIPFSGAMVDLIQ